MEKCAKLDELLTNQPDKLDFTLLSDGNVKIAGMDELFTQEELTKMLTMKIKHPNVASVMDNLLLQKHASIEIPSDAIPIRKEAENTAVIVDMYEVDYVPETEGQTTQAITKSFNALKDFVSRMTFPDTTVPEIIVGPKKQVFKHREEKVKNPNESPETGALDTPEQLKEGIWKPISIWKKSDVVAQPQAQTQPQQVQTQTQNPQQTGQFGKQPDGTFRYTYRNASVLVNPNTNNILVNVWVRGQDNNSIQVGINSAAQIATNALKYYASNIQMPVQLLNRMQHRLNGNYITVPFTFQVNQIQQAKSWRSMTKLG